MSKTTLAGLSLVLLIGCGNSGSGAPASGSTTAAPTTAASTTAAAPATAASSSAAATAAPAASGTATAASATTGQPTCDIIATRNDCLQYVKTDQAAMDHAKTFCADAKGTFTTNGCPKDNLLGVCQMSTIHHYRYSKGAETLTADKAKKSCDGVGDWKPAN